MSDSALRLRNRGAYTSPFSGVGVEFFPLGVPPDHSGFVLHEAGYLANNDCWDFPNVLSPFWRLYYNARRGHKVIFSHGEYELTPERLIVIPDHQLFHCRGLKPAPNLWLAFSVARRLSPNQPIPIVLCPSPTERAIMRDFTRLFSGNENPPAQNGDRIFHSAMALMHVVLSRPEIQWRQTQPESVIQTVRYIEEHYASPMVIPRLAKMANLCTEALARSFKKHQGDTIGRFIAKVRVREAAHLLTHTDARIDDDAERTGFPNREYLSRVFKRITGESPAEFRRRHTSTAIKVSEKA
jgi:AraC family transcriptional regulator, arabinose operon regulatory protein